jgi:hypothetical protein
VSVIVFALRLENFPREIFFAIGVHVHFGCRNSSAHDPLNLQSRTNIECRYRVFEKLWRHSGICQSAQKHVAADAGKTVEVGYAHGRTVVGR